jgi:hypothetical protein
MKKSNVAHSQRGLKRHKKNVERLKRAKALREFNHIAQQVKAMQAYMKAQEEQRNPLIEASLDS